MSRKNGEDRAKTIFSSSQGQLRVKDSPKCAHDVDVGRILRWGKFIDVNVFCVANKFISNVRRNKKRNVLKYPHLNF